MKQIQKSHESRPQAKGGHGDPDGLLQLSSASASTGPGSEISSVVSNSSGSSQNSKLERIVKQLELVKRIQNTPTPKPAPNANVEQPSPVDEKKVNQVLAQLKAMKGTPTVENTKSLPVNDTKNDKKNSHIVPPYVP